MKEIHITQIENGYLVATPPKPATVKFVNQVEAKQQPTCHYCPDMQAVSEYILTLEN